jgi:hypothetical protein
MTWVLFSNPKLYPVAVIAPPAYETAMSLVEVIVGAKHSIEIY